MNKSKFLKRSLATLLAILMVVAMVPSAFAAAGDPDVIKIGGEEAKFDGDAYTVSMSVPSGTSGVVENALKNVRFELRTTNGTTVGIINKDGAQNTTSLHGQPGTSTTWQSVDLLANAVKPEGTYWGAYTGISLKVTANDGTSVTYPLTINVSERNASSDTSITAVESSRIVGAEVDNTAHTIVITKPVGVKSDATDLGLKTENFKASSPNAKVSFVKDGTNTDQINKVIVTAEDKSTQEYTVSYKVETIFDEFTVPNMISYEQKDTDRNGNVTITVKVPFESFPADPGKIIPTFTPSDLVKTIMGKDFSPNGSNHSNVNLYDRDENQTTSGVAEWAKDGSTSLTTNTDKELSCELQVKTGKSSLSEGDGTTNTNYTGKVVVNFVPVANPAAKLTGINVGTTTGAATFSQGLVEIAENTTSRTIIVGDIPDENLIDKDNGQNEPAVVNLTTRDLKLHVSKNAKVTVMNPWDDGVTDVYSDTDHDGIIDLDNVNLRKYHSTAMHLLVEAEDGAYNHATNYYLTFAGTPTSGKPVIQSVTLVDTTNGNKEYTVTPDKEGKATFKLPAALTTWPDGDWLIRVAASDGATVHQLNSTHTHIVAPITGNELGMNAYQLDHPTGGTFTLHASYDPDGTALDTTDNCTAVVLKIEAADKSKEANITSLVLTDKTNLLEASTNKFPTTINHDKKTIRVEVPFNFAKSPTTGAHVSTDLYAYSWTISAGAKIYDATNTLAPFVVSNLGAQITSGANHTKLVTENDGTHTTTIAGESTFDVNTNGLTVNVYSEFDTSNTTANPYKLYFVRRNANSESKLNNVTASAPVSVALDTSVAKLNRYIITVPQNYNSTTGINNAKAFELTFDRSAKSIVKNNQRTWLGADDTTAEFKVADGNLYFKNEQVTVTDGRIIHFTVVAEDGTSTGEYEFVVRTGAASSDATLSSVKVDDEVSFVADGTDFVVKDLSEDENYDVTKLPVIITTTDPGASVTVDGKEYIYSPSAGSNITVDLSEGKTATVEVTAADGVTKATYTLSMSNGQTPPTPWENPFKDVKESDWFYDAVKYVSQNELMVGDPNGRFNPRSNLTRAEFAQILYKKEGNPDTTWTDKFSDVKESDWYAKQIIWASENDIMAGYPDGKAHPRDNITREQLASLLWRYEGSPAPAGTALNFSDANLVGSYAKDAMIWAVENGIMQGNNNKLNPKGNATRAEAAQMLMQYFNNN